MQNGTVGEIALFAGNFPPQGWKFCEGQLLDINEYIILYSVIGNTYGGDGKTTFALPDLRGVVPVGITSSGIAGGAKLPSSLTGTGGPAGLGLHYCICYHGFFPTPA